jgi:hypothetical protein
VKTTETAFSSPEQGARDRASLRAANSGQPAGGENMKYYITITVPNEINQAQEQRAHEITAGNVDFPEMIIDAVKITMHNLTGNKVAVQFTNMD